MSDELTPDVAPVDVVADAPVEPQEAPSEPETVETEVAPVETVDAPVEPQVETPVEDVAAEVETVIDVVDTLTVSDLDIKIADIIANSPVPSAEIAHLVIPATDASPELPL
jgi:hypothetical protein